MDHKAYQPALPWEAEKRRLSAQANRILWMLRDGKKTNSELSRVALNYTARLSDLRQAGYDIRCVNRNYKTGVSVYELMEGVQ